MIELFQDNCLNILPSLDDWDNKVIVTDPPFNIGYHYNQYDDNLDENQYLDMLFQVFNNRKCAVIHYPEFLFKLAKKLNLFPNRILSWVYNSNTPRQHRNIAYFNVIPDFYQILQPYKNLKDKRIQDRIKNGKLGSKSYDWFIVNQVKNVSKEKSKHPCQMPIEAMLRIVGIIPKEYTIVDPFMGSGTTGIACKLLNRNFIGIELNDEYFNIAKERIDNANPSDIKNYPIIIPNE